LQKLLLGVRCLEKKVEALIITLTTWKKPRLQDLLLLKDLGNLNIDAQV